MNATSGGQTRWPHTLIVLAGALLASALGGCVQADAARSATSVSSSELDAGSSSGTVDQDAMVAAHNEWRSQVGVPDLSWSDTLADAARTWAEHLSNSGCAMYHSGNGHGENIYQASALIWSSGRRELQKKTPKNVVNSWGSEVQDYDYASNSCSGVCGHYTQVVWKQTAEVGCAMAVCDDKSQIWVCNYAPPGNVVGQRPY